MKKIKLLAPILGIAAFTPALTQVMTSCGVSETNIIPTDLLDIDEYTLKGLKAEADVSKYSTLVIPEGIKYIDDNAFAGDFAIGGVWSNIQNVVFPKSLKGIRNGAFAGCTSLRVFDCTEWTIDQINYLEVAEGTNEAKADAFDSTSPVGHVYTSDSITKESRAELKTRLVAGGLSPVWFADEVEDRISADETWKKQSEESGVSTFKLRLNVVLPEDTHLIAYVTKTSGTDGVEVEGDNEVLVIEDNLIQVPVYLLNQANTGDYACFNITVVAVKVSDEDTEVLWKQTLNDFTLTNIQPAVVNIREIRLAVDESQIKIKQTLQVNSTIYPKNADDTTLVWTSSDSSIAKVDSKGLVTGVSKGDVVITATAKDTGKVSSSIALTVKPDGIEFDDIEYHEDNTWLRKDISSMEFNTTDTYTFIIDTSNFEESEYIDGYRLKNLNFNDGPDKPSASGWKFDTVSVTYKPVDGKEETWVDEQDFWVVTGGSDGDTLTFDTQKIAYGDVLTVSIKFSSIASTQAQVELGIEEDWE